AAHDLARVDHRRIEREDALAAFAVRDLPHREVLVQAASGAADANALIGLHAAALAFDDLDVDDKRIARLEIGDFLTGRQLRHLFVFDLLKQVHGEFSIGGALNGRGSRPRLIGLAQLLRYRTAFVTRRSRMVIATLPAPCAARNSVPKGRAGALWLAFRPPTAARQRFWRDRRREALPGSAAPPTAVGGCIAGIPVVRRRSSLRYPKRPRP